MYCPTHNNNFTIKYFNFVNLKQRCKQCGCEAAINTTLERYGTIYVHKFPRYNKKSIIYLNKISELLNVNIQHAENGGEKIFGQFRVDGFIEKYNICIEWNEPSHYWKNNRKLDLNRNKKIISKYGCIFFEINEKEFLKDSENNIIKIAEEIKNLFNFVYDKSDYLHNNL